MYKKINKIVENMLQQCQNTWAPQRHIPDHEVSCQTLQSATACTGFVEASIISYYFNLSGKHKNVKNISCKITHKSYTKDDWFQEDLISSSDRAN